MGRSGKRAVPFLAVVISTFVCAAAANGQCIVTSFSERLADSNAKLIFHGAAKRIDSTKQRINIYDSSVSVADIIGSAQIVTFEVLRTWKGSPTRNIIVYNPTSGSEDEPIVPGHQYFVIAYSMSAETRESFGLPKIGAAALITSKCSMRESSNPYADNLTGDDPGIVTR